MKLDIRIFWQWPSLHVLKRQCASVSEGIIKTEPVVLFMKNDRAIAACGEATLVVDDAQLFGK